MFRILVYLSVASVVVMFTSNTLARERATGRSPASIAVPQRTVPHPQKQGELMLFKMFESEPRFLRPQSRTDTPLELSVIGACQDGRGLWYSSEHPDYPACMIPTSNSAVDVIRSSNRMAGVGILWK